MAQFCELAGRVTNCTENCKTCLEEEAKIREIEIGDKVRYITEDPEDIKETGYYPPKGTIGTVIGIDSIFAGAPYLIQWPEGTTKWNGRWYVEKENIELVQGLNKTTILKPKGRKENIMKLAEKLAQMSNEQATKEEEVTNEIVNFFAEKLESGEMMEKFEKKLSDTVLHDRKTDVYVEFWKYIPGCSETHFSLLGNVWEPENPLTSVHKGVDLCIIYKNVLEKMTDLAKDYFEKEGFVVESKQDPCNKRYISYVITISW